MQTHRSLLLRIVVRWKGKVKLDLTFQVFSTTARKENGPVHARTGLLQGDTAHAKARGEATTERIRWHDNKGWCPSRRAATTFRIIV